MQRLYKPRARHTAGTAVSRMDSVSSVVFRSQQKGTSSLLLDAFFQCNYTVSQFHTLTLSLQRSCSVFIYYTLLPLQSHLCLSVYLENDGGWQIWHGFLWPWPQGWLAQLPHLALSYGSLRVAWEWDWLFLWAWGPQCCLISRGYRRAVGRTPTNIKMKALLKNTDLVRAPSLISRTGQNNIEFLVCPRQPAPKGKKGHKSREKRNRLMSGCINC